MQVGLWWPGCTDCCRQREVGKWADFDVFSERAFTSTLARTRKVVGLR